MIATQALWIVFGVFVLGLFIGCNLGVLVMCVLQMSSRESRSNERPLSYPFQAED